MSIEFVNLTVRSARRIRLTFSSALAAGAFVPTWFTVTEQDAVGSNVGIAAALVVPASPRALELALDAELAPGGLYLLSIGAGIPGVDTSTAPAAERSFRTSSPKRDPSPEVQIDDVMAEVFQVDLVHDDADMVEDASGDLATVGGPENAKGAVKRRIVSDGLPWRSDYGLRGRRFVDAAPTTLVSLRGRAVSQIRVDDRVEKVDVSIPAGAPTFERRLDAQVVFVGGFAEAVTVRLDA